MPTTAQGGNLMLAHGEIYFDRYTAAGLKTGERFLGNCTALKITPNVETKEKYDSTTAAGSLLARAITRVTHELAISMDEFSAKNLALMLLGDDDTYTQAATAVVDELLNGGVAVPSADAWYPVAGRQITAVTVKVLVATKTINTDYLVDAVTGRIYIVKGGTIVPGTDIVKVSYTPTALTGATALDRVKASTVGKIEGSLRYIGVPVSGPSWEAQIYKVSFTPDGQLDLIADDFGSFGLKGLVLADGIHTELYALIKRS